MNSSQDTLAKSWLQGHVKGNKYADSTAHAINYVQSFRMAG